GVDFLEGTGFYEGVNPLPGADRKMVFAGRTNLEIEIQFLVEDEVRALRALRPDAFGNLALAGGRGGNLGLADEGGLRPGRRRRHGGFHVFRAVEDVILWFLRHKSFKHRGPRSTRRLPPPRRHAAPGRTHSWWPRW